MKTLLADAEKIVSLTHRLVESTGILKVLAEEGDYTPDLKEMVSKHVQTNVETMRKYSKTGIKKADNALREILSAVEEWQPKKRKQPRGRKAKAKSR